MQGLRTLLIVQSSSERSIGAVAYCKTLARLCSTLPMANMDGLRSVESRNELRSSTRHVMNHIETIIKITSFEMMGNSRIFRSAPVGQVGVCLVQKFRRDSQLGVISVVEDNDSESILGVVNIAGCLGGVNHKVDFLSAAGDEDVHGGNIITN